MSLRSMADAPVAAVAAVAAVVALTAVALLAWRGSVGGADGSSNADATPSPPGSMSAAPTPSPSPTPSGPATVTVTAVGDSVPSGSACHCEPYVSRVADALGRDLHRVPVVHNLAVGGLTSQQVRASLAAPSVRRALASADLTIIEVGANDFRESSVFDPACEPAATSPCYAATLSRLRDNIGRIVSTAQAATRHAGTVAVLGYWNVFKDGAVGRSKGETYVEASDDLTRVVNTVLAEAAERQGAIYVDAYRPFKGSGDRDATGDLAPDGDHPNSAGHQLLADAVVDALRAVRLPQPTAVAS